VGNIGGKMDIRNIANYEVKDKTVKRDGREYRATMVFNHSTLDGLISETRDLNYEPGWSTIRDWHTTIYILKKGSKKWELFYNGRSPQCPVEHDGLFNTLKDFENEEEKAKDKIRECEANIYQYKKTIEGMKQQIKLHNKKIKGLKKSKG
jgi:hypothetical protein